MKQLLVLLACSAALCVHAGNALQEEILAAVKAGEKNIQLKEKEYRLESPVSLAALEGITIDGNQAKIVMTKLRNCFQILGSRNLTLRNFSVDYDPLPFTQGVIDKAEGNLIEFTVDDGYSPAQGIPYTWNCHVFTPDGKLWKKGQRDVYAEPAAVAPNRFRLRALKEHPDLKPGDRIAIAKHAPEQHAFYMRETGSLTFENLTIYASPGCVFNGYHCDGGDVFKNVTITRGPVPAGATQPRLLSSCADAVHYGYCRKGAQILHCDFAWMGDDSFNHHGKTSHLAEVTGSHTFTQIIGGKANDSLYLKRFRKGDRIRLLDGRNFRILGEYTFVSYRKVDKLYPKEFRDACFPHLKSRPEDDQTVFEITVAEELKDITAPCRWDAPDTNCRGFRIADSYFHDHRAYGLRIMASEGVVENNRFERIKGSAIVCGGQYAGWGEAGWSDSVVIRNNVIKECDFSLCGNQDITERAYMPGAISVFVQLGDYSDIVPGNRNITILNNKIEDCAGPGIFVMAADGVNISGNSLSNTATTPFQPGAAFGFKGFSPIWILNSKNVSQSGNTIR